MTDQLSRDLAVRDEISKQERSAMEAKAVGEISAHATGFVIFDWLPSPRKPKVETVSSEAGL